MRIDPPTSVPKPDSGVPWPHGLELSQLQRDERAALAGDKEAVDRVVRGLRLYRIEVWGVAGRQPFAGAHVNGIVWDQLLEAIHRAEDEWKP